MRTDRLPTLLLTVLLLAGLAGCVDRTRYPPAKFSAGSSTTEAEPAGTGSDTDGGSTGAESTSAEGTSGSSTSS